VKRADGWYLVVDAAEARVIRDEILPRVLSRHSGGRLVSSTLLIQGCGHARLTGRRNRLHTLQPGDLLDQRSGPSDKYGHPWRAAY
jgi:hypothetical protein